MHLIQEIVEIFENYQFSTEILVASVRHHIHIVEAARMGADICTCPPAVIEGMFKHPLTDIGLERFLKDWEKAQAAGWSKATAHSAVSALRPLMMDTLKYLEDLERRAELGGGEERLRAPARGRQAHGARAHRSAVRSRQLRGGRQARHPPVPRLRHGRADHPGRRRRRRPRPGRRPPGLRVRAGLHRLRRVAVGDERREDREDHGSRDEDGRAGRRPQRLRAARASRKACSRSAATPTSSCATRSPRA